MLGPGRSGGMKEERSADHAHRGVRSSGHVRLLVQPGGYRLRVRPWSTAADVKQQLREHSGVPVAWMRLFDGPRELPSSARMLDLVPSRNVVILTLRAQNPSDFATGCYLQAWGAQATDLEPAAAELLSHCQQGLTMGFAPQLSWDGTGGTYVMRGAGREPLAAFKPRDEEPFAPNNPRGLPGKMGQQGIHGAIPSGEAHVREVVAYRLDHSNFASVPLTLQAEAVHPAFFVHSHVALSRFGAKLGSLQAWVASDDVAANLGCATFPTREVHKIALLDMRLLNTDRNDSNILVRHLHPAAREQQQRPRASRGSSTESAGAAGEAGGGAAQGATSPMEAPLSTSPIDLSATPNSGFATSTLLPPPLSLPVPMERSTSASGSSASTGDSAAESQTTKTGSLSPSSLRSASPALDEKAARGAARQSKVRPCELLPIDHGGCLPASPAIAWFSWCWLSWPQMSEPLDDETKRYVAGLDPAADARLMAEYDIAPQAIRASRCATLLVQHTVASGLSLHEAALLLCRPDEEVPSELERLITQSERLVNLALSNPRLRAHPDSLGGSPKQRQAVGTGRRPSRALSSQDLASLHSAASDALADQPPVSACAANSTPEPPAPAGVRHQWSWGETPAGSCCSTPSACDSPEAALERPAGATPLHRVFTEGNLADSVAHERWQQSSGGIAPSKLHRVLSDMAIASTPSSPYSGLQHGGAKYEHGPTAELDATLECTFYDYYGRMLDEAIGRVARRLGASAASAAAKASAPVNEGPEAVKSDAGGGEALPNDVISALPVYRVGGEALAGSAELATGGPPPRRRAERLSARDSITE